MNKNKILKLLLEEKIANLKGTVELRKQIVEKLRERVKLERAIVAIK